jgi:CubicO group peptidase (beta-lactamase class C family)
LLRSGSDLFHALTVKTASAGDVALRIAGQTREQKMLSEAPGQNHLGQHLMGVAGVQDPATRMITAVARGDAVETHGDAWVPWWSYTKTALAAAALVLVSQGRLHLDDHIERRPFTLLHLLQHRAGLPEYGRLAAYHAAVAAGEPPWPKADLLRRVQADNLLFEPGHGWSYSNVGYLFVREMIEEATGSPLGAALKQLVLDPLDIADAEVACSPADLDGMAWSNVGRYDPGWVYHGLLVGRAGSAALLLHRLLAGRLLPADLLSAMRARHPIGGTEPGRPWQSSGYGLGLMIGTGQPPALYVGHTGGGPGSTSAVFQCAEKEAGPSSPSTAAAFAPVDHPGAVEGRAMALAYQG